MCEIFGCRLLIFGVPFLVCGVIGMLCMTAGYVVLSNENAILVRSFNQRSGTVLYHFWCLTSCRFMLRV